MPIKKQKQNHREEDLLALHQESFPLKEGIGSILNQEIISLRVNTTLQMTRFRGEKVCSKWPQERIDDHSIQADYKLTTSAKVNHKIQKEMNSVLGITSAWCHRARHQ